jgi:hypothetical protein
MVVTWISVNIRNMMIMLQGSPGIHIIKYAMDDPGNRLCNTIEQIINEQ